MIFQGRIFKILPLQTGTSKDGKEWRKQEFVFVYFENPTDRWSDKVVLSLMGNQPTESEKSAQSAENEDDLPF